MALTPPKPPADEPPDDLLGVARRLLPEPAEAHPGHPKEGMMAPGDTSGRANYWLGATVAEAVAKRRS